MSGELVPRENTLPASTRTVINVGKRGLEYVNEKKVGVSLQTILLLIGGVLAYYNIDAINHFVKTAVDTGTWLIKGGVTVAILWVMWNILSSKVLRRTVAQALDQMAWGIHMWWIDRDKFGAAQYAIRKLGEEVETANEAKGVLDGTRGRTQERVDSHKKQAQEAFAGAKGLIDEINQRRVSGTARPANSQVAKLTDTQLQTSFDLKKSQARSHYNFFQDESKRLAGYDQNLRQIDVIIDAVTSRIAKLDTDLKIETERWESEKENLVANQAASRVIDSPAYRDYQHALDGIKKEAFAMRGQARRYMDMLDPTVKAYQADQAMDAIADDDFFNTFATDLGLDAGDVKTKLLPVASTTDELPEIAELLGTKNAQEKMPVEARASQSAVVRGLFNRKRQ